MSHSWTYKVHDHIRVFHVMLVDYMMNSFVISFSRGRDRSRWNSSKYRLYIRLGNFVWRGGTRRTSMQFRVYDMIVEPIFRQDGGTPLFRGQRQFFNALRFALYIQGHTAQLIPKCCINMLLAELLRHLHVQAKKEYSALCCKTHVTRALWKFCALV